MSLLSGTEPVLRRERLRHWMQGNEPPDYWLARFVFLRGVGFLYLVAFFSLANQLLPLLGSQGLLPVELHLDRIEPPGGSLASFWSLPSLFWLSASDGFLLGTCWLGVALSLVVLLGYANALLLAALWFLYLSFVQVG